jgi:small subunit ribosomal protein YMR-31
MRATQSLLRHIPSIKFVGGKHPHPAQIDSSVHAHVFSAGILPGSSEAIKVSSLPKRAPAPPSPAPPSPAKAHVFKGITPSDKEYQFIAVKDLPKRFQPLAFDESELDAVNGGGAGVLF